MYIDTASTSPFSTRVCLSCEKAAVKETKALMIMESRNLLFIIAKIAYFGVF